MTPRAVSTPLQTPFRISNPVTRAILDDVDAAPVGPPGIAPRHGVVAGGPAPGLPQAAQDREAGILEIKKRILLSDAVGIQQHRIGAGQPHRVTAPDGGVALRIAVKTG